MTDMQQPSLQVAHLVKQYANADRPVLNDISFEVPHGKVFVIVGPSGSGKSTLLRTIAGLEPIQGGTISLNGEVIETGRPGTESAGRSKRSSELRTRVGMVFQSYDLFPNKTVLGNITLAPTLVQKRDKAEVEEEAVALLERVGLADRKDAWPHELSGGQRQRVAICRALILHPEVLEDGGIVEQSDDAERFFTHPQTERAQQFLHTFEFDRHRTSGDAVDQ